METFLLLQYRLPLGCCVHGTPIYAALKAKHPGCKVIVATCGLGAEVLQHDPNIDCLLDIGVPGDGISSVLAFAKTLRSRLQSLDLHPTQILQDASNRRGTLALLALLLRLAPTAGFADLPQLYDRHLDYDPTRSLIANNLRLVGDAAPQIEPAIYFAATDLASARSLLREVNPDARPLTAFILQGSGAQPNSWHDDRFATVIRHVESLGHHTVYLGTTAETSDIDRIRTLAQSSGHSLAGRTKIPVLAAFLCLCDYAITVDTGSMHVARCTGVPMVVLAPSWQQAIEWLPLDLAHITVLRGPDMSTDIPANYRLDEIAVDDVIAAFTKLCNRFPASAVASQHRVDRLLTDS